MNKFIKVGWVCAMVLISMPTANAVQYHVSVKGSDSNKGTKAAPFLTIQRAADLAQPGDVITVHEGIYRERINPPRGGTSDEKRIVYQAAPGERVVVKGSEVVTGWEKVQDDVWTVVLPNSFFGDFNPFDDLIRGDWFVNKGREHHTGAVYLRGHWLVEAAKHEDVLTGEGEVSFWFAKVDERNTTIWAQFKGVDPNQELVEVNARQSVFYPEVPGINYITVRGFTLEQAATPWAPPTAEQIGLIGTHWSKGWVIEDNVIRYSTCVGITLGKYGDEWDNRSESANAYNETIKRALAAGWNKETVGSHIVRNNNISHAEQAGIVGSLGAAFSTIEGNEIHEIHVRQLFTGAELAGIKFHAPIDTLIRNNHIYRCRKRGIWLDWMSQGTRVSGNLLHDNAEEEIQWSENWDAFAVNGHQDLFMEVNHGPFMVDNNLFLSAYSLNDRSQGGVYAHNVFAGEIRFAAKEKRQTPYHKEHSTEIAGLHDHPGGDSRFYNNLFIKRSNLEAYDDAELPVVMKGNVYFNGARPSKHEADPLMRSDRDPGFTLSKRSDGWYLQMSSGLVGDDRQRPLVTTEMLGRAAIPDLPYEQPDGTPYRLDADYFGNKREAGNPAPGPFEHLGEETNTLKIWPVKTEIQR